MHVKKYIIQSIYFKILKLWFNWFCCSFVYGAT
jgi:hypothetical protein